MAELYNMKADLKIFGDKGVAAAEQEMRQLHNCTHVREVGRLWFVMPDCGYMKYTTRGIIVFYCS